MASRPEKFHLRALLDPCRNLSIHTAPDVRPSLVFAMTIAAEWTGDIVGRMTDSLP